MDYDTITSLQINRWHRIYLNAYWAMIGVVLILSIIGFSFRTVPAGTYLTHFILIPVLSLAGIVGLAELMLPRMEKVSDYFMITVLTAMCIVLVSSFTIVEFIQTLYLLPILISIFYIRRRAALYAFGLNLIGYYITSFSIKEHFERLSIMPFILMQVMMVAILLITLSFMARSREIIEYLKSVLEAKQDLFVQNVVMDKIMKTDALTGLYNHRTFHEYLDKLLDLWKHHSFPLCLAIIDIDNFKKVNDTYGHLAGDIVLREVGTTIQEKLTPNDFAARYGGEEFAIILTEKSLSEVYNMMEKLRISISLTQHSELDGQSVTVSIGLYQHHAKENKERLFEKADTLLYQAKHSGKNRTACASLID